MGQTYKLSDSIGLELEPVGSQQSAQPSLDFCSEGLSSVDVTNFTGRIIIHRTSLEASASILFSDEDTRASVSTSASRRGSATKEDASYVLGSIGTAIDSTAPDASELNKGAQASPNHHDQRESDNVLKAIAVFKGGTTSDDRRTEDLETEADESVPPRKNLLAKQLGGIVTAMMNLSQGGKRKIPESIRMQRRQVHDYSERLGSGSGESPPTELHHLCSQSFVTADELYECYNKDPKAVGVRDAKGRYPLHILGDNESLITSSGGRQIATSFARHLFEQYPEAITFPDANGDLPFFTLISDWIQWATEKRMKDESKTNYAARSDGDLDNSIFYDSSRGSKRFRFPRVELWEEVEWCFLMISIELDTLARDASLPSFKTRSRLQKDIDKREELIAKVLERLPKLYTTVLLLEDDGLDSRARALEMDLFKRLLFCPEIVGGWLTDMIAHGGVPSQRAVDYLCMISESKIEDYRGAYGTPHEKNWQAYYESQEAVFARVVNLKGTMASLVTLREDEAERAASTAVIWKTMSAKLRRPFILGLILIDLVLHVVLMFGFRNLAGITPQIPEPGRSEFLSSATIYMICLHYAVRFVCECFAMQSVSNGALRGHVSNLWNVFDWGAISCTFIATLLNDVDNKTRNGLDAFVVGLLWIKVLAFLKVVNRDMAVFILSLGQILKDTRYFMFVLLVIILMFGDMFHIAVVEKDDGAVCHDDLDSGTIEDFCSSNWESYLRVYSMLLGDFELDELTDTTGSTVLFIIFTILGVIILLNILIAIISDSYEKATLRGRILFAKARLLFVAQNEALERFLKPRQRSPDRPCAKVKRAARWITLAVVLFTASIAQAYIILTCVELVHSRRSDAVPYIIIHLFCGALLGAALWVVSTFLLDGIVRQLLPESTEEAYDFVSTVNSGVVSAVSNFLFGDDREKIRTISDDQETNEDEWTGRMAYTEKMLNRIVNDAKRELKAEFFEMKEEVQKQCSNAESAK
mmetsp:Transcript_7453/g.20678  ORF Transcript_7453/g.20678 Transcript_7453/m.20678 type:complete len:985 (+) Transcript_7453:84-3038(+)